MIWRYSHASAPQVDTGLHGVLSRLNFLIRFVLPNPRGLFQEGLNVKLVWRMSLVALIVGMASLAIACNIPVFRYALENWQPDPYRIAVVHRGALTDEQYETFRTLQQASSHPTKPANVVVFDVDLDAERSDGERREIPETFERLVRHEFGEATITQPTIAVYFPDGVGRAIWQGSLDAENVSRLIDSPIRQEVTKRLVDGQSAVWILINSGDIEKDKLAEATLSEKLSLANEKVLLPDQQLIEAEDEFRADNPIELRVDFSMVVVDRENLAEQAFVAMLLHSEEDLSEFDEPIAVPIFGRGRTYFALIGKGINEDNVLENCGFVCGACSCQVKQANPGIDTLMAFDWSAKITGSAMPDVELPELTGIGDLIAQKSPEPIESAVPTTDSTMTEDQTADVNINDGQVGSAITPEEIAVSKAQIDEDVVKPYEQGIFILMAGGAVAAAAIVFFVSLLFRRAA